MLKQLLLKLHLRELTNEEREREDEELCKRLFTYEDFYKDVTNFNLHMDEFHFSGHILSDMPGHYAAATRNNRGVILDEDKLFDYMLAFDLENPAPFDELNFLKLEESEPMDHNEQDYEEVDAKHIAATYMALFPDAIAWGRSSADPDVPFEFYEWYALHTEEEISNFKRYEHFVLEPNSRNFEVNEVFRDKDSAMTHYERDIEWFGLDYVRAMQYWKMNYIYCTPYEE